MRNQIYNTTTHCVWQFGNYIKKLSRDISHLMKIPEHNPGLADSPGCSGVSGLHWWRWSGQVRGEGWQISGYSGIVL